MSARLQALPASAKAALVAGGYAAAVLLAFCAVWVNGQVGGADDAASAGMQSFGDAVLFLAVLGLASIFPTGLGIYFLWPRRMSG
jgi:hypothetical protein